MTTRAFPIMEHHFEAVNVGLLAVITPVVIIGLVVGWLLYGSQRELHHTVTHDAGQRNVDVERPSYYVPVLTPVLENGYYEVLDVDGLWKKRLCLLTPVDEDEDSLVGEAEFDEHERIHREER